VAVVQYTYIQNNTENYTKRTVHRTTQKIHRIIQKLEKKCGPCPVFADFTLAFALQTEEKARKNGNLKFNVKEI
jgi:hypothetical protein